MYPKFSQKLDLNQNQQSRQASLQAWLAYHSISKQQLAEILDVHPSMITRIIQGKRAPAKRIRQLIALGIPPELLPKNSRPPGRPPAEGPKP